MDEDGTTGDGVGIDGICGGHPILVGIIFHHLGIGMIGVIDNLQEFMFMIMVRKTPSEEKNLS
jgi:hypothetical protein